MGPPNDDEAESRRSRESGDEVAVDDQAAQIEQSNVASSVSVSRSLPPEQIRIVREWIDDVDAFASQYARDTGVRMFVAETLEEAASMGSTAAVKYAGVSAPHGGTIDGKPFFDPDTNEVLLLGIDRTASPNLVAHELGHAVAEGFRLHEDPRLREVHEAEILNNPKVDKYFRTGSRGTAESGLKEWIAESQAAIAAGDLYAFAKMSGTSASAMNTMVEVLREIGFDA